MNVTELIKIIEKDTGFSQSQVKAVLDSFQANIISTLKDNKLDDAKGVQHKKVTSKVI